MEATGIKDALVSTANAVHQMNSDVSTVFSNAPLEERILPSVRVGTFAVGTAAMVVGIPGGKAAASSAEIPVTGGSGKIPDVIYRGGGTNPGNLTPRPGDEGMLSFRDSLSNPWPLQPGQRPVLRAGEPYFGIDTSKLPPGSVIYDNNPIGHISVLDVPPEILKNAIIIKGVFPK